VITVALNNMGFHKDVPGAEPYMSAGVEGYIQAAIDLGFSALQLQTGATGEFRDADSFRNADTDRIRAKLEAAGIEMHLHHHGTTSAPDVFEFAREESIFYQFRDYLISATDFIHRVGGTVVTFHPPFADTGHHPEEVPIDEETRLQAIAVYDELMREAGQHAAERSIELGIESAVWGPPRGPWTGPFLSPKEMDEFVKRPGMPDSVGILAEISHLHHMGYDLPTLIEMWGTKIHEVHTSDAVVHDFTDKRHYGEALVPETHRVVGEGTLDFRAAIRALHEVGFDGWLSLEIFPMHVTSLDDFVRSKEILETIAQKTGS